jgi:hypothetical protein
MDGQTRFTCGQSGPLSGRKAHRLTSTVHVDDMDACDSKQTDEEDPDQEKVARESGDAAPKTKPQLEPELEPGPEPGQSLQRECATQVLQLSASQDSSRTDVGPHAHRQCVRITMLPLH